MFIAVLFIMAKIWRQPRCASVGKWINKLWQIQKVELFTTNKKISFQDMEIYEGILNIYG